MLSPKSRLFSSKPTKVKFAKSGIILSRYGGNWGFPLELTGLSYTGKTEANPLEMRQQYLRKCK